MSTAYSVLNAHAYRQSPREVKDDVVNAGAGGAQNLASLARVEGAGHLVSLSASLILSEFLISWDKIVQMNPRGLAQKIHDALVLSSNSSKLHAKL